MAAAFSTTGKTLAFLPLLGVASPFAQAAEVPFPSLSPFPNQPDPMVSGSQVGQTAAIASPITPLADSMSVEASSPQFVAQVLPTDGATQTQVLVDAGGDQFEIRGGAQAGENLFHRFDQLDLEAGQTANFQTPAGLEAVFSQVGGGPSSIDGTLKVSGSSADLFLLNPNGVVFGPNAQLDLNGSFTATTADRIQVGDQWVDLLEEGVTAQTAVAGSVEALEFSADAAGGAIANQGQLAVTDGQSLGLLGNAVVNTGSLSAPGGEVTVLSASGGQRVSLEGGLLNLELPGAQAGSSPRHSLPAVVAQPVAEATGLSLNADGSVSLQAGTSVLSGTVDVSSAEAVGGQVKVLGNEVQVTNAVVDASGAAGGDIHVGGDYQGRGEMLRAVSTRLNAASVLRADGIASNSDIRPDGGEVIVWSDGTAEFAGTATARSLAPGGDGGLVETSGKQQLNIVSTTNVNTASVDGATGRWLIDPLDLTVVNGGGVGTITGGANDPLSSTIDAATVETALDGNNVQLQATNSITVDAPIDASTNISGGNLGLDAPTLNLNERVTLVSGSQLSGTANTVNVGANGSIQNAVDAAVSGGTVNLAAATYREGSEIIVDKQIRLQGQGTASTTISGDANGDGNAAGNRADNHRILHLDSSADGTTLSGITFSDGITSSGGGGIENDADNVTIENSVFSNNRVLGSGEDGGAIHTHGDGLRIDNTLFTINVAEDDGGAIDIGNGSVEISNSIFADNGALNGDGGAIDIDPNGSLTIAASRFESNTAVGDGGAIYSEGRLQIDQTEFDGNLAVDEGGGIALAQSSDATIEDSRFISNSATRGGGIVALGNAASSLTITNSEFELNTATTSAAGDGGAVQIASSGSITIQDSEFRNNEAQDDGGAIEIFQGALTLRDNAFSNNRAADGHGGALDIDSPASVIASGNTFTFNEAPLGGAIANDGSISITNDLFQNNVASVDGGAIYQKADGIAQISTAEFTGNTAGSEGGAIYQQDSSTTTILNSDFRDNQAVEFGGAIANQGDSNSQLDITGGTFLRNRVTSSSSVLGDGGAIFIGSSSSNTISGTTFSANTAALDGGAIAAEGAAELNIDGASFVSNQSLGDNGGGLFLIGDATLNLSNSVLAGNTAAQAGGGLFQFQNAKSTILNTRFENNQAATSGGAIASQINASGQLTISGSTFDSNSAQQDGGGLYLDAPAGSLLSLSQSFFLNNSARSGGGLFKTNSADLTIANTLFERNTATDHGGGLAAQSSSGMITLMDSNIVQNVAGIDGGGIRLNASNLSASNSLILTNEATFGGGLELGTGSSALVDNVLFQGNDSSSHGGAISIDDSSMATVTNSRFLNNQSDGRGGAINTNGSLSLDTSLVQANSAAQRGGGIALQGSSSGAVTIRSTTVNGNTTSASGGGLSHEGSQTLMIEGSTFSNNNATANGAGLDLNPTASSPPIQLQNSTISSNISDSSGGGLSLGANAPVDLNNVTVANNTATSGGGGLTNLFGGSLTLQNTIVAGNTAASNPDIAGVITSLGNNIVRSRATSTGYVSSDLPDGTDPLLLSLANNGGLTETHALRANSVAVDAGNGSATFTDQRGLTAVNHRDIGAYELDNNLTAVTSGFGQTTQVTQAFANPIELSITDSFGSAIAGVDVVVSAPTTGASASLGTLRTDDSGVATAIATANTVAGTYAITLDIGNPLNLYGISLTNTPDVPDQIAILNGDNQSTVVNTAFANPLQLAVTDQFGNPIPLQALGVSLPGSGASATATNGTDLNAIFLVTDSAGQVMVDLTANTIAGNYGVGLTSGSLSNNATLTNLPDAPAQLLVNSGNNQSTVVNTAFANPLQATVTDQFGNAVPGVTVDLSLPGAGASSNAGEIALTTDNLGQATTSLTANTISGSYAVGLTAGVLASNLSLENLPDAPAQLNGNAQTTVVNTAFADPLQVTVTDQFGNAVPGVAVNVSLPGAGASANAGTVALTTDAAGQANTGLVANTTAGGYGLSLSAGSLTSNVPLTNLPDAPAHLDVLDGDGQSTVVNTAFSNPLLVAVTDQFGNVVPGAIVNLSFPGTGANVSDSSTGGAVSLTTDSLGQASTSFVANTVAGSYGIGLSTGTVSSGISLTNLPDAPAEVNLLGGNEQVAQVNTTFADELRVQVLDQFGNVIPGVTVTFTAPTAGPSSAASAELSAVTVTTDGAGEGQALATANGQAGAYQVEAEVGIATVTFELENVVDTPLPELPEPEELPQISLPPTQAPESPTGAPSAPAPLSLVNTTVVEEIDSSFSAAYTDYWGTPASRGVTVAETRMVLDNATEAHGVNSAVVYGLFVPQAQAADEGFGATQVASMALNRRAQTEEQRDDDQLMLVLVPSKGPLVQQLVSVTREELLQQARLFRMAVSDPYDEWSYKPLAQQMYSWMLEPVESELERLKLDNVMYVMDAGLRTLPLAAMMKEDEFAIERYGISLIPSVDLLETDFGASAPSSQIVAAGATEFEQLNDLPAVGLELDVISSQAIPETTQQNSVNVLFNEDFTQENLLQAQQEGPANMLHLATHGEFNAGDLGSSYLQFWDDQLTLDDISKLGWDELELLILSACQTAISSPEAELGFAGLAAATGVESTIGSLWSVSDIGTLGLMSEFYGQLAKTPLRFEALRQAQMAMLQGETRLTNQQLQTERGDIDLPEEWDLPESADFSHPFYWSGFTLVGNPWW